MRKIAIVALIACLPSLAVAQQQTLPQNTVLGRLGTSPGPAQAIPFTTLANSLNLIVQTVGVHKVAVGGATTLTGIGPLTTGQLLLGVTGSDPAACTNCTLAGAVSLSGGVTGPSPTPQLNLGSYFDNGSPVSISHLGIFSTTIGFGVTVGQFNYITLSGGTHDFYTGADLTAANFALSIGAYNTASTSFATGTARIQGGLGVTGAGFFGNSVISAASIISSGVNGTSAANQLVLDNPGSGLSRVVAYGQDASTNGHLTISTIRSDGSNLLDVVSISTSGAVTFINTVALTGASSGTTTLSASAIASGTLTLPAATDTLMGKATPDVMTNKTLDTAATGNIFKINGTTINAIGGNTAKVGTVAGVLVSGHCVAIDANLNFIDAGGACTTGGAGGTVSAGNAGELPYYSGTGTAVIGNANLNVAAGALTLGIAGSVQGSLKLAGSTSGTTTIAAPVAGTGTMTLQAGNDTVVGRATTDTLINKTIDGNNNTLTVLGASQISGTIPASNLPAATDSNVWSATASVFVTSAVLNSAGAIVALSDAATIATDMATGINFSVTLGGNRTLGAPTNTQAGRSGCYFFTQDGSGTRTLVYNAVWKFANGTAPTLSTTAGAVDMLCYVVKDSTHIIGNLTAKVQ